MRDIFKDIFADPPIDPVDAARRSLRGPLRKKFFTKASTEKAGGDFAVLLDGRPVRTPGRRALAAPSSQIAQAIADEWQSVEEFIDPARMPMTRLANTTIDGVAGAEDRVAAEIEKYLASDLVFYRATEPEGLVARQSEHWDPMLAFAREKLGARFVLGAGVTFVTQPEHALQAARQSIPRHPWRLGAIHVAMTLTGSALLALALAAGETTVDAAWSAAHVDEDWNMAFWGRDEEALKRRAFRFAEMQAAATVLSHMAKLKP
jgi:chaperone required for assembly of F1-ATPase